PGRGGLVGEDRPRDAAGHCGLLHGQYGEPSAPDVVRTGPARDSSAQATLWATSGHDGAASHPGCLPSCSSRATGRGGPDQRVIRRPPVERPYGIYALSLLTVIN